MSRLTLGKGDIIVPLAAGFSVLKRGYKYMYALRHMDCSVNYNYPFGQPVIGEKCDTCNIIVPPKVMTMFKLWEFHNDMG